MLTRLYIKNYTLIDELDIDLFSGFSVITGETGAGKSIILGAIGLLLGQRADSKAIKQGADKCIIEAHFDVSRYDMRQFFDNNDLEYDDETIIRRELTASGKSRAFVNDSPAPLSALKELGERLVDIHSQHQNLLLNKQDFQLSVIDIIANNSRQAADYQTAYSKYQESRRQLEALERDIEEARQRKDFLQFQYDELTAANLSAGEQEELEAQSNTMTHAEDIKAALYTANEALMGDDRGCLSMISSALSAMHNVSKVLPAAASLAERLNSTNIELKDIAAEVSDALDSVDFDPAELDRVNNRLDRIYDLEKKYNASTVDELISKREELQTLLDGIAGSDDTLQQLREATETLHQQCCTLADKLTATREKAAHTVEANMQKALVPLGMPNVRFAVDIRQTDISNTGQDTVSFLFSANTQTPMLPVTQVASGGEIARVMLSLKAMISGAVKLPTIIFDEIDTGVSGKIAEQMAAIMLQMGINERQVISITHLPQIAAQGQHHYKVSKSESQSGTVSRMMLLADEERITEIAQMLSGSQITEAAIQNAKELLKLR